MGGSLGTPPGGGVGSSLTTLAGLHVAMLFEWCVQAFPSGHVGPRATAGKKRRFGKGLHKRRWWHGRSSSQEVEAYLVHVMCSAFAKSHILYIILYSIF